MGCFVQKRIAGATAHVYVAARVYCSLQLMSDLRLRPWTLEYDHRTRKWVKKTSENKVSHQELERVHACPNSIYYYWNWSKNKQKLNC